MAATHSLDLELSSSQHASIADASCPNLEISGSQTWECWVKLESLPAANMAFMGKSESTAAGWAGLYYNTGTPNTFRFHLHGLTTSSLIGSIATPVAGVWTHVAGVYDGSTLKIYINGELDNSTAASGNHTDSNGNFAIGRLGVYTLNWYYDGLIRNARVWNVARTQQQIRDNMNVDTPVGTGLQGNWILNNSYTDSSSNGYTLTASGSPVFSTTYPDAIDLVENQTFTKKHKITVQHTQVAGSANLTDVPIVFTESNFLSDIFTNSQGSEINTNKLKTDSNLKAYYRFESGALTTDSSGNGYTLTNNNTVGEATGKFGIGADLGNGNTNKYLSLASDLGIGGNANISISIWFKMYVTAGTHVLIQHASTTGASRYFQIFQSGGLLYFDSAGGGGGTTPTITAGVWYHAVFTRTSAGACTSYLNAVYAGAQTTGAGTNGVRLNIGVDTANYSSAVIDDVAIFNRVLSAEEVRSLYAGGQDLRFSSDIDGKTRLAHEIVSFDKGTSKAEVWVKANTLDFDDNTDIYVHYGNATASALDENDAFGKHQVWGNNWKGVWHFQNNSIDSSKNNNDGTDTAITYDSTDAVYGTGAVFNGSTSRIALSALLPTGNAARSIIARVKLATTTASRYYLYQAGSSVSGQDYGWSLGRDNTNGGYHYLRRFFDDQNSDYFSNSLFNNPIHLVITYDGTTTYPSETAGMSFYTNGNRILRGSFKTNVSLSTASTTNNIGYSPHETSNTFNGRIYNLMVFNGDLSDDTITTLYNNQNSPSTFAIPSGLANASFLLNFV